MNEDIITFEELNKVEQTITGWENWFNTHHGWYHVENVETMVYLQKRLEFFQHPYSTSDLKVYL
jgi:hypothetical protein